MIDTLITYTSGVLLNMAAAVLAFAFVSARLSPRDMLAWWRSGPLPGKFIVAMLWPVFVLLWLHKDWREPR
jgi:hypothetical protein